MFHGVESGSHVCRVRILSVVLESVSIPLRFVRACVFVCVYVCVYVCVCILIIDTDDGFMGLTDIRTSSVAQGIQDLLLVELAELLFSQARDSWVVSQVLEESSDFGKALDLQTSGNLTLCWTGGLRVSRSVTPSGIWIGIAECVSRPASSSAYLGRHRRAWIWISIVERVSRSALPSVPRHL